jgi:L-rhamnose mutarotase
MKEYNIYLSLGDKSVLEELLNRHQNLFPELYEIIKNADSILVRGAK